MSENYPSWGRYPEHKPQKVIKLGWRNEVPDLDVFDKPILPYGYGKSYGDSCQNSGGVIIETKGLDKFIKFNPENNTIRTEAGVTLAQILDFIVPRGYFLASTPGTKHISVGGAIANDVHGKNHHKGGTFGCHLNEFELIRSDGAKMICSREENSEMFSATIGGLGLTGLITQAEFGIKPVDSAYIAMESIKVDSLEEFFEVNKESEQDFDYTVSWVDCTATGANIGRGLYSRGNHASPDDYDIPPLPIEKKSTFPFDAPFINFMSVYAFNQMYYHKQLREKEEMLVHFDKFFYPLDAVNDWNKAYGKNGFLQYQFVIPFGNEMEVLKELLVNIESSGLSSFLTVLKTFGDIKSPGMLSFPRPGVTMAIDFRMDGQKTLDTLTKLDDIVKEAGGVLYPAKDARMPGEDFRNYYPEWKEFSKYIDPAFSSSFWRRVMK